VQYSTDSFSTLSARKATSACSIVATSLVLAEVPTSSGAETNARYKPANSSALVALFVRLSSSLEFGSSFDAAKAALTTSMGDFFEVPVAVVSRVQRLDSVVNSAAFSVLKWLEKCGFSVRADVSFLGNKYCHGDRAETAV
jgi:hypothetical protein